MLRRKHSWVGLRDQDDFRGLAAFQKMKSLFPFFRREFVGDQLLQREQTFGDERDCFFPGCPTAGKKEMGSDRNIGVPSEGQRILRGGSPVMVEARAM